MTTARRSLARANRLELRVFIRVVREMRQAQFAAAQSVMETRSERTIAFAKALNAELRVDELLHYFKSRGVK